MNTFMILSALFLSIHWIHINCDEGMTPFLFIQISIIWDRVYSVLGHIFLICQKILKPFHYYMRVRISYYLLYSKSKRFSELMTEKLKNSCDSVLNNFIWSKTLKVISLSELKIISRNKWVFSFKNSFWNILWLKST